MSKTDKIISDILLAEYSEEFDKLRKARMVTSYTKYGPIKENYGNGLVNSISNLEIRLKKYKDTGNTDYLIDIANQAMIEFMFPQHKNSHYDTESHGTRLDGLTFQDIKNISGGKL